MSESDPSSLVRTKNEFYCECAHSMYQRKRRKITSKEKSERERGSFSASLLLHGEPFFLSGKKFFQLFFDFFELFFLPQACVSEGKLAKTREEKSRKKKAQEGRKSEREREREREREKSAFPFGP